MQFPAASEQAAPNAVRVFLCGDVMTGRGIDQALPHPGNAELREGYLHSALDYLRLAERANGAIPRPADFAYVWGVALEIWARMAPDVRLMNLETTVTRSDHFAPKGINYRMHPANAPCFSAAGLQACALANNHILDFGAAGLAETVEVLHRHGVQTAGAGRDQSEARAFAVVETKPGRVLLISVAADDCGAPEAWAARPDRPGLERISLTEAAALELAERIRRVRRPRDIVVLSIHWGSNWGYQVPTAHRRFAHALIDSGQVSVIHGHSSHHPRPMEVYRGRLILYGCGDFLNDYEGIAGYEEFRGDLVAMYFADLDADSGALRRLLLAPLKIRRFRLGEPDPAESAWLASTLSRESRTFGLELAEAGGGLLEASWPDGRA